MRFGPRANARTLRAISHDSSVQSGNSGEFRDLLADRDRFEPAVRFVRHMSRKTRLNLPQKLAERKLHRLVACFRDAPRRARRQARFGQSSRREAKGALISAIDPTRTSAFSERATNLRRLSLLEMSAALLDHPASAGKSETGNSSLIAFALRRCRVAQLGPAAPIDHWGAHAMRDLAFRRSYQLV